MKPLIWVEGIIGCGKTTFAREVGKRLGFLVLEEPVEDNPYLGPFYQNPAKYAFGFQIFMLHRRYAMQRAAACVSIGAFAGAGAILDRSIAGDCVFAKMHMQSGNIDPIDWKTYEMAYEIMCNTLLPPTLLVYLDAQPETAFKRMQMRNREAESKVPLSYLKELRAGYTKLIEEAERGLRPWGHAVKVRQLVWDPVSAIPDWDAVASTIGDACGVERIKS